MKSLPTLCLFITLLGMSFGCSTAEHVTRKSVHVAGHGVEKAGHVVTHAGEKLEAHGEQ